MINIIIHGGDSNREEFSEIEQVNNGRKSVSKPLVCCKIIISLVESFNGILNTNCSNITRTFENMLISFFLKKKQLPYSGKDCDFGGQDKLAGFYVIA